MYACLGLRRAAEHVPHPHPCAADASTYGPGGALVVVSFGSGSVYVNSATSGRIVRTFSAGSAGEQSSSEVYFCTRMLV